MGMEPVEEVAGEVDPRRVASRAEDYFRVKATIDALVAEQHKLSQRITALRDEANNIENELGAVVSRDYPKHLIVLRNGSVVLIERREPAFGFNAEIVISKPPITT